MGEDGYLKFEYDLESKGIEGIASGMLGEGWFGLKPRRGFINAERDVVEFPEQFKESNGGMQVKCGEVRKQGSANCGNWHSQFSTPDYRPGLPPPTPPLTAPLLL